MSIAEGKPFRPVELNLPGTTGTYIIEDLKTLRLLDNTPISLARTPSQKISSETAHLLSQAGIMPTRYN
jgi:hypothetical protein